MGRNSFFQFKQFRIEQDRSPMKVTTEGCIFAASIALEGDERTILDIGTGTGLLALMLAQRSSSQITGVELDADAANQAQQNFDESPWSERLRAVNQSIQAYAHDNVERFDLVISNPPYFTDHLKSGRRKDIAIHDDQLSQSDLIKSVVTLLHEKGTFWVIYPALEFAVFESIAGTQGLQNVRKISVKNYRDSEEVFREIGAFRFAGENVQTANSTVVIRGNDGAYSSELNMLLEDYYL